MSLASRNHFLPINESDEGGVLDCQTVDCQTVL